MKAKFIVPKNDPNAFSIQFEGIPQEMRQQIMIDLQRVIQLRDKLGSERIEQIHTFLINEAPDFLDNILPNLMNKDGSPIDGLLGRFRF